MVVVSNITIGLCIHLMYQIHQLGFRVATCMPDQRKESLILIVIQLLNY